MTITVFDVPEQTTAAVRSQVPMSELTEFFSRAFRDTMTALQAQGVQPTGAPFAKYYGPPGATIDVEAGFPVASEVSAVGDVAPGTLPGGRVAEATHVGPFDTLTATYDELATYFTDANLTPGPVMWESYLTDPDTEPDPARWRTEIFWPLV